MTTIVDLLFSPNPLNYQFCAHPPLSLFCCYTSPIRIMACGTLEMSLSKSKGSTDAIKGWLNTALFATQAVEKVGLSFDRYKNPHQRKQQPQRTAAAASGGGGGGMDSRSNKNNNKGQLMAMITYENKRKRGLWNSDTELAMWNTLSNLIGHFERHLWVLVPLHPSVLHEDSIRFALLGQPSERVEDFPLLFNVNVAMACGTYHFQNTYASVYVLLPF